MSIPTAPPSGFRDFLPQDAVARAQAIAVISGIYRSFGFQPILTSAVEDLAVLTGKGGGENEKLIFKIQKRGEKLEEALAKKEELTDLGLRFDLTLPLARYYTKHGSLLPRPFKAFQIGPVWRAERAQKGRFREFYQCDIDIIGSDHFLCEVEVISAILSVFRHFGLNDVTAHLNDRSLVYAALEKSGVPAEKIIPACIILDKLDKVEREKVLAELTEAVGQESAAAIEKALLGNSQGPEYAKLSQIAETISAIVEKDSVQINPALMRGFDYYTGPVFEFRSPKFAGSIGGGGRYDRLTEKFGGQKVPACGGSIGFERLLLLLEESKTVEGPKFCVTVFSDELREKSLKLAAKLRGAGASVDVFPGSGKLGNQFKYADAKHAAYALIIGPDEAAAGQVKAKNLKTGEEKALAEDAVLELA